MEVKVITRHGPINYGSVLQSLATIRVIERLGHNVQIIDYLRKDERGLKGTLEQLKQKSEFNSAIKKILYFMLRYPEDFFAERHFDCFRKKYLKLTKRCYSLEDLKTLDADVFMTGSDQVWRPVTNGKLDEAYFLRFVESSKKVAYSSSFGKTVFSDSELNCYKNWLAEYKGIAVREDAAVSIIRKLGIANRFSILDQVVDPVLLLSEREWSEMVPIPNISKQYVLIYQIHKNPQIDEYARNLASKFNIPVLKICTAIHQIKRGERMALLPDLDKFLSLIKNCSYLVTDSFHGSCFALLFHKKFAEILPQIGTASRNESLMRLVGLENRIVTDFSSFDNIIQDINYKRVDDLLQSERKKSIAIMQRLIEE